MSNIYVNSIANSVVNYCGVVRNYDCNGTLIEEYFINNGKIDGIFKSYSCHDGCLYKEEEFVDDNAHGMDIRYSENGSILMKKNILSEIETYYNDNGEILYVLEPFGDVTLNETDIMYSENGSILMKKNILSEIETYYNNNGDIVYEVGPFDDVVNNLFKID